MRSRLVTLALLGITVVMGLASRSPAVALPLFIAQYGGDVLWASMVFFLLALAWPHADTAHLALGALVISVLVEVGQLYHAPWIDAVRATWLGAHILGQGFLQSDLACYAVGVGLAALVDGVRMRRRST